MTSSNHPSSVILFVDLRQSIPPTKKSETEHQAAIKYFVRITSEIATSLDGQFVAQQGSQLIFTHNAVKQALRAAEMIALEWKEYSSAPQFDKNLIALRQAIHLGEVHIDAQGMAGGADANIAQRISTASVPGGIALSETAYSIVQSLFHETEKLITEINFPAVAARYTVCLLPSIDPSLYPLKRAILAPATDGDVVIIQSENVSPEKFSFADTLLISAGAAVVLDFVIANIYMKQQGVDLNSAILNLSNLWMLLFNIVVIAAVFLSLLRSALKIRVKTLPEVDVLVAAILKKATKANTNLETVVKKKELKWLKVVVGKIDVSLSGNDVVLAGHWYSMRQFKKLLKSRKVK
jgi:hypothetical protein